MEPKPEAVVSDEDGVDTDRSSADPKPDAVDVHDTLLNIIGIGESVRVADFARNKLAYLVEACMPGKPS
jgi:hypothetical protein